VVALTAVRSEGAERLPELPHDLERLQEAISRCDAALVVIDPLVAYLAAEVNAHRDQDVRRALAPVAWVAHRTGAAVLVVRHLTKSAGGSNAVRRGGGSIGIIGAARSGLLVAADPDDEERRVLAPTKANLARLSPSLLYRIVSAGEHASAVEWLGETPYRADDLLAEADRREHRGAMEEAVDFLRQALAEGPIPSRTVWEESEAAGIARITLRRAKDRLGVRHVREGFGPGATVRWELPGSRAPSGGP
jgi:RecA-family ATPase